MRASRSERRVVGVRVPVRLVHREHDAAGARRRERRDQLARRLGVAVRVVLADVRVRVVEVERPRVLDDPLQPRPHGAVDPGHRWPVSL